MIPQLQAVELAERLMQPNPPVVLDVREGWEYAVCALSGSTHIPLAQLVSRRKELDPDTEIVCLCHHGVRSLQAGMFLKQNGYSNVSNLAGGIDAWAREVASTMARY